MMPARPMPAVPAPEGSAPDNPFLGILRLSSGDFVVKSLHFATFIYLARVLGVERYGVLEFALSILTYFMLLADGGLEMWAIREVARGGAVEPLAGTVLALRGGLSVAAGGLLLVLATLLAGYPDLKPVLGLFALTLVAQSLSLKWIFMGRQAMRSVAAAIVLGQAVFSAAVFVWVRDPSALVWVPVTRLAGDLATAATFAWLYRRTRSGSSSGSRRSVRDVLVPALTLGGTQALALMSFNVDTLLLFLLRGASDVGGYGAAYKLITAALAVPLSYFLGLYPVLARGHTEGPAVYAALVRRSIRLTALYAFPVGVVGSLLAGPLVGLFFGPEYASSVLALQILSWSAVLVILRGTFRQAFNAAGRQRLDFACAATSVGANLALNALLIPRYGIPGAATATLVSEGIWFGSAVRFFSSRLARIGMTVSGKRGTSTARCPGWVGWGAWLVQGFRDEHRGRVERSAPRSSNASAKRA